MTYADLRDDYIAKVVQGKTFVDVGGLWGTVNEKVSVAHQLGAVALTMIDYQPKGNELWQKFDERMKSLGIKDYHSISQDIGQIEPGVISNPFDIVHCSGVLYHHPNPMHLLATLRQITRQNLILTSSITQEVIENEKGCYQVPASGVIFVPALNNTEFNILKTYWEKFGVRAQGLTEKIVYNLNDFEPWWWLPTAFALARMCETAGFKVIDKGLMWNNNALTLLLKL
ncbi:tRNA (mo5U34)-methyltransferase [Tolypothrix sp. NIES-4075]|uniref:methyltransferase domain-containing protein n=1 Tax=Tolypothrix sp. NIES-4075 TaxID=2005459 RepID=UPI000B5C8433|nr:methyltransferase domain-containing protein [Tolypothrix sp. NIES-4075]GAX43515.1 tRNA (mo5U34)-methyltransferase [Tolypothrix sp. NIES-4075]